MTRPARRIVVAAAVLAGLSAAHMAITGAAGRHGAHGVVDHAALMAALMLPLAALDAPEVARRALPDRRGRAVAEHAAGFGAAWLAYGLVAAPMADAARALLGPVAAFALLLAGAVAWQLSPARLRLMERCGRVPVAPPRGWKAETRTAANGASRGAGCVRTCWAPMLAMAAAPHLVLMGAVAAANLAEWAPGRDPFPRARRRRPALAYAALAVLALALAAAGRVAR